MVGCEAPEDRFADMVLDPPASKALDLTSTPTDPGLKMLCRLLQSSSIVQRVTVDTGVSLVVQQLKGNDPVASIDLSGQAVPERSAVLISELVRGNSALKSLNLSHGQFGERGCDALTETLRTNTAIETLVLSDMRPLSLPERDESDNPTEVVSKDIDVIQCRKFIEENVIVVKRGAMELVPLIDLSNRLILGVLSDGTIGARIRGYADDGFAESWKAGDLVEKDGKTWTGADRAGENTCHLSH